MFKSGAVRLERLPLSAGTPHIREQHSSAIAQAETKSAADTTTAADLANRQRHLELWLCETYETTVQLIAIYSTLIPSLVYDLEVEAGVRVMRRLAEQARAALAPHVQKYGENKQRGDHRAHLLRRTLFPSAQEEEDSPLKRSAYEVLETLQGLRIYLAHVRVSLAALIPAAQALWDREFVEAVQTADKCLSRMESWVDHQVKVRSPQTLLVPVKES